MTLCILDLKILELFCTFFMSVARFVCTVNIMGKCNRCRLFSYRGWKGIVCDMSQQTYRMSQIGLKSVQNEKKNRNWNILSISLKKSLNFPLVFGFLSVIHLTIKMQQAKASKRMCWLIKSDICYEGGLILYFQHADGISPNFIHIDWI